LFGVFKGALLGFGPVVSAADDASIQDDHGAYGDFTLFFGLLGFAKGLPHKRFVGRRH
jgi:hypothetical protein